MLAPLPLIYLKMCMPEYVIRGWNICFALSVVVELAFLLKSKWRKCLMSLDHISGTDENIILFLFYTLVGT